MTLTSTSRIWSNTLQFVRDLGTDLERFRRLSMSQITEVTRGLVCAGFVKRCEIKQTAAGKIYSTAMCAFIPLSCPFPI